MDFYSVPTGTGLIRDGAVAGADFFAILGRFGTTGTPGDPLSIPPPTGYHAVFDRGPSSGPNVWNLTAANGAISGTDFFAVLGQFGHTCVGQDAIKADQQNATSDAALPPPGEENEGPPPPCYQSWEQFEADAADDIIDPPCDQVTPCALAPDGFTCLVPSGAHVGTPDPDAPLPIPQWSIDHMLGTPTCVDPTQTGLCPTETPQP